MAKLTIECPNCHRVMEAKSGLWGQKEVTCACGQKIPLRGKSAQQTSRVCPNCHNTVMFDLRKGANATCPLCKAKLMTADELGDTISFACKQCGCIIYASKSASEPVACPSCGAQNDVLKNVYLAHQKRMNQPVVLQYEGGNDTIVWKHPLEDFVTGSRLIVHENQEAVFFREGKMLDSLGPGDHVLETNTLPLYNSEKILAGSEMRAFHSEVYFVNLTTQTGLGWGVAPSLHDPGSDLHVTLHTHGIFNIKVVNARKLLSKIVGTQEKMTREELFDVNGHFRKHARGVINSLIAEVISAEKINLLTVDENQNRIAERLTERMRDLFADYGMAITEVIIENIGLPQRDEDPLFWEMKDQFAQRTLRLRQAHIEREVAQAEQDAVLIRTQTDAQKEVIAATGHAQSEMQRAKQEAEEMKMKGYTHMQDRGMDVALAAASNEGIPGTVNGAAMASSMGIGFGLPFGAAVANIANQSMRMTFDSDPASRPQAGSFFGGGDGNMQNVGGMPFNGTFGGSGRMTPQESPAPGADAANVPQPSAAPSGDIQARLDNLEKIRPYLTEEQYNAKIQEIFNSI